jgi:hypothetical protein
MSIQKYTDKVTAKIHIIRAAPNPAFAQMGYIPGELGVSLQFFVT